MQRATTSTNAPSEATTVVKEQKHAEADEAEALRNHSQKLRTQLHHQHLYQDATHIMVQRAAQLEFDLDQTAAMLCNEMAQGLESQNAIARLQELSAYEQGQRQAAMAVASSYRYKLYIKNQELHHANEQLSAALAKVEETESLLAHARLQSPTSAPTSPSSTPASPTSTPVSPTSASAAVPATVKPCPFTPDAGVHPPRAVKESVVRPVATKEPRHCLAPPHPIASSALDAFDALCNRLAVQSVGSAPQSPRSAAQTPSSAAQSSGSAARAPRLTAQSPRTRQVIH